MTIRILHGDCRDILPTLPSDSFDCIVTSPPYWGLRDYGVAGQIGLEPTLSEYLETMVAVCRELRRVLKPSGTFWLNVGDSYAASGRGGGGGSFQDKDVGTKISSANNRRTPAQGFKPKDLCMVPNRLAIALQDDGWYVRSEIIWAKPNPMPESVSDRPTGAHEKIFLLTKSARYFYDADAVREPMAAASITRLAQDIEAQAGSTRANGGAKTNGPMKAVAKGNARSFRGGGAYTNGGSFDNDGSIERETHGNQPNVAGGRNLRNVWAIATRPFKEAHFATFPPELAERCIKAGSSEHGCCPHCGVPWARAVISERTRNGEPLDGSFHGDSTDGSPQRIGATGVGHWRDRTERTTLWWSQQCGCSAHGPIRASVLDPFGGAGTTGLVADRLGRHATLIELNPAYAEMASHRIESDAPLLAEVSS